MKRGSHPHEGEAAASSHAGGTTVAMPSPMRRALLSLALASSAFLIAPGAARAAGLWLSTNGISPNELRVAIAASPDRTTVWTSLDFDSRPTTIGLVMPVPSGTRVDIAPDAWFAALDTAMAPRVFTAPNLLCPDGTSPPWADATCVAVAEWVGDEESIPAVSFDTLDGPEAVTA